MIIGIDPGKDGFFCFLGMPRDEMFDLVHTQFEPMPTIPTSRTRREYDVPAIVELLKPLTRADTAYIEKQHAMRGQGVSSTFSTGYGYGMLMGILTALGIRHQAVGAKTWQKVCFEGVQGKNPKAKSVIAAQRFFPDVDFRKSERCKKNHDGKTDAVLIAWYGWLQMGGGK